MPQGASRLALEFEVLMGRATRQGRIDLEALLETYGALVASQKPELADPRRVDLPGLVQALTALPPNLGHGLLLLVPDLRAYTYTPIEGPTLRCGRLPDGTVLGEAPLGSPELYGWVASLCLLAHELRKAARLLADLPLPLPDVGPLAFALGHDEYDLAQAIRQTRGELINALHGGGRLPEVRVHASLHPDGIDRLGRRQAQQVVTTLAESGLADRPLHIWLGDGVLTDVLSPYTRELRPVLWRWAQANPYDLGADLRPIQAGEPTEDMLYAVLNDFMQVDPRLAPEKTVAERTVGIYRYRFKEGDGGFELIDMGRVDPHLCDPRLPAWRLKTPAPTVLRLDGHNAGAASVLRGVLEAMGGRIVSITVAAAGLALGAPAGTVVMPRLLIRWGGGDKLPIPLTPGLSATDFLGLTDRPVQSGAVVAVPSLLLASAAELVQQHQAYGPAALEIGDSGVLEVLYESLWAGQLSDAVEISWLVVGSQGTDSGRPNVSTLRAWSAAAIARLRRIVVPPASAPPPAAGPSGPTGKGGGPSPLAGIEPRRSTSWAVRIKA